MNTCKTCKHWDILSPDLFARIERNIVPGSFISEHAPCGAAERIQESMLYVDEDYVAHINSTAPAMVAVDGESYCAVLFTHADHGCLQWEGD